MLHEECMKCITKLTKFLRLGSIVKVDADKCKTNMVSSSVCNCNAISFVLSLPDEFAEYILDTTFLPAYDLYMHLLMNKTRMDSLQERNVFTKKKS